MNAQVEQLDPAELVQLAAVDSDLYGRVFFPKTCRQPSPEFHREMDRVLDDPRNRYVSFQVFRGGAKTTKLRLFTSKRIAYGISHTILFVGKSQDHAVKSVEWLMRAVEYNPFWAKTFQLQKGRKWTSTELEILHGVERFPIRVIALGITGSIRGVNVEDYRPDLIVLDDPLDEENTATPEQRAKIEDLTYGALFKSLAPASEAPDATIALAQTPLHPEDLSERTMRDPSWASVRFSCFDSRGESAWPERWSTEELLREKEAHIQRNQLSLWLREMECKLVTQENAAFKVEWLREHVVPPEAGITYIGIDPTPPPRDGNSLRVNEKLDDAVIMVIRVLEGTIYVCEYYLAKSPDPEEFVNKFFELALRWRPMLVGVETTLFQRMLKWYMEKEMLRRRQFFTIVPVEDKRKKETRIIQTITRYAANGRLSLAREHSELKEQYGAFQAGATGQRDDMLDALTIAMGLINPALEGITLEGDFEVIDESGLPEQLEWRTAP